jgi:uncharacterized protein (TIGR02646 family)
MIRLHRGAEPGFLAENKTAWTERFNRVPPPRDWATEDGKEQLREALEPVSQGKCAFCESLLGVATYREIEHYWPKSRYGDRVFIWENLFLACRLCNGAKSDQDHGGALVKPDDEEPERLFWLNLDSGKLEPRDGLTGEQVRRVQKTIQICDLNRGDLCQVRLAQVRLAMNTLVRLGREGENPTEETRSDLTGLLSPRQSYKFTVRFVFEQSGNTALARRDREVFEEAR